MVEWLVKLTAWGILGIAGIAILASLISGLSGKSELIGTFMPVAWVAIAIFVVLALLKFVR